METGLREVTSVEPSKTILAIQSSVDITTILKFHLERKGYNFMAAHSGPAVFNRIREQKPDLIFLGLVLPESDGFEVLSLLKSSEDTSSIPVVMLTARLGVKEQFLALGADGYIAKPFVMTQITDEVHRWLGPPRITPLPINRPEVSPPPNRRRKKLPKKSIRHF